jgi:hypothetical protein
MFLRLYFVLVGFVLGGAEARAEVQAIIAVGLATDEGQATRLRAVAETAREGFLARGFKAEEIQVLLSAKRDTLLAALATRPVSEGPTQGQPERETWIVLLGTAAAARDGQPAWQVTGPRFTASDLVAAIRARTGKTYLVIATAASGGFLPGLLALPGVEAVAATSDTGEVSEPRFAEYWAEALVAQPQASFSELAREAAASVAVFYGQNQLAEAEHARRIDRASGTIVEAPFAQETRAEVAGTATSRRATTTTVNIGEFKIPQAKTEANEQLPATPETLAIIAEAKAAAEGAPYPALHLRKEIAVVVQRDFAVRETTSTRSYLRTSEALDDLATVHLPSRPPLVFSRLDRARVIRPDGSQIIVNPRALGARAAEEAQANRSAPGADVFEEGPSQIELPEVTAGCVVEIAWSVERRASKDLPEFYDEWSLTDHYPTRGLKVAVTLPRDASWRAFAPNLGSTAVITETPTARTQTWTLEDVSAYEPLPGDPVARTFIPWIGVSSLASWDKFANWYRRLAAGSETIGPEVTTLAADIAKRHPDRAGRIRAAYERVAALRYVAIELGVGGLRPRTPEQVWRQRFGDCKDKANLLVAVLKQLGIEAEFVLVNRFDATFPEFPGWQFNHAIARVPAAPEAGQPQALWLDTTDRLVPFGVIASGDLGRQGLVFAANGTGATFHEITAEQEPPSEWTESFQFDRANRVWTLRLSAKGSAEVMLRRMFVAMPAGTRVERLSAVLPWGMRQVKAVKAGDPYDCAVPFVVEIELTGRDLALGVKRVPLLIPGLNLLEARLALQTKDLSWDEGRTWTVLREERDSSLGGTIPGRFPISPGLVGRYQLLLP